MAAQPAAGPNVIPVPDPNLNYVFVQGNNPVPQWINMNNSIHQSLVWIGFNIPGQRNAIMTDAFTTFEEARLLTVKDIASMATTFAARTQINGRIIFGTRRTKLLKAFIHWINDFYRVSQTPTIVPLTGAMFISQLNRALSREEVRDNLKNQTSSTSDAASPGPLKNEREWKQWEEKFTNYCASHIGAFGIPLSYVIREHDDPADDPITNHPDFVSRTVARAPLDGEYYFADRLTVFKMIISFTTGQPSGDWVKDTLRYNDGRRSMNALRAHFAGEGNATRNISTADRLQESLHYKGERAMAFETFLTNCQKMFNIYETEGEPMNEETKVRFLFKRVQHDKLQSAIEALKAQQTAGTDITYTMAANHLSSAVAALPEYISRNRTVAGVTASGDGDKGKEGSSAIYNPDGSINTGFIPNWRGLSAADRAIVQTERKRLGLSSNGKGNSPKGNNSSAAGANRLKQLEVQNKKYKRQIKSMKRGKSTRTNNDDNTSDNDDDDETDAGDQFGGKNARRKKKQKK